LSRALSNSNAAAARQATHGLAENACVQRDTPRGDPEGGAISPVSGIGIAPIWTGRDEGDAEPMDGGVDADEDALVAKIKRDLDRLFPEAVTMTVERLPLAEYQDVPLV
jgi:hypothetical protein